MSLSVAVTREVLILELVVQLHQGQPNEFLSLSVSLNITEYRDKVAMKHDEIDCMVCLNSDR